MIAQQAKFGDFHASQQATWGMWVIDKLVYADLNNLTAVPSRR